MEASSPSYPARRLNALLERLCRVLTERGPAHFISAPVILLIWNRLMRLARRFTVIAERTHAGARLAPRPPRGPCASTRPPRPRPADVLPDHFRWLVNMFPEAEAFATDLCWLLNRVEMQELLFNAPEIGRVLRPHCRMLGVEPPSLLRFPAPPRAPAPPAEPDQSDFPPLDEAFWKLHPPPKFD